MAQVQEINRKRLPDSTDQQRLQDHPRINNNFAEKTGRKVETDWQKRKNLPGVSEGRIFEFYCTL
jgi:hypothetical protein